MAEKYLANYRLLRITCNFFEPGNIYIHARNIFKRCCLIYIMGVYPFYGKVPQHLLWVGSQAACGEVTVNSVTNFQNYFITFIAYT